MVKNLRGCLVYVFKQSFSVFKQYFTYFHILFHPQVFSQVFSNNNFQFLNTCTKWDLTLAECLHQTIHPQKLSRDEKKLSCLKSERECNVNYIMATSIFFHCKFTIFLCYDNPNFKWSTNSTCELGCKFFCTVAKLIFFKKKNFKEKNNKKQNSKAVNIINWIKV